MMGLVRFGFKNAVRFGYYRYLLIRNNDQLIYSKYYSITTTMLNELRKPQQRQVM